MFEFLLKVMCLFLRLVMFLSGEVFGMMIVLLVGVGGWLLI